MPQKAEPFDEKAALEQYSKKPAIFCAGLSALGNEE